MTLSNRRDVLDHAKRVLQSYVDDATIDKEVFKQLTKASGDACAAPISSNAVELYVFQELVASLEASGKNSSPAFEQIKSELQSRQTLAAASALSLSSDAAAVATEGKSLEAGSSAAHISGANEATGHATPSVAASLAPTTHSTVNALKERMMKRRAELEASKAAKLKAKQEKEEEERQKIKSAAEQVVSTTAAESAPVKRARSSSDETHDVSASSEVMEGAELSNAQGTLVSSGTATPSAVTVSPTLQPSSNPAAANLSLPESDSDEDGRQKTRSRVETNEMQDFYGEADYLYGDILADMASQRAVNSLEAGNNAHLQQQQQHHHHISIPAKLSPANGIQNPQAYSKPAAAHRTTHQQPPQQRAMGTFEYEDV